MTGPTKLNSVTSTTTATPSIASRFCAKVRPTSRHGLPLAIASPPSGSTCSCTSTVGREVSVTSVSDSWVEDGVADVGDEVADDGDHADEDGDPEHDLVVVAQGGVGVLKAGAGEVEYLLDDQGAGEDVGNREAHERDDGDHRVA